MAISGARRHINVIALCSYPIEAAATRYRLSQYVGPLAERGISLRILPFLTSDRFRTIYDRRQLWSNASGMLVSTLRRAVELPEVLRANVLLVQREAMLWGPPLVEWLGTRRWKIPLVLDLDDATYTRYVSPTYGWLGGALKWFRKTNDLIDWSTIVICGNPAVARYVEERNRPAVLIPTVVDLTLFQPSSRPRETSVPVIGWIGSHSTFSSLERLFPIFQRLAERHRFRLRIVGSGRDEVAIAGVDVEHVPWNLEREIDDFQSLDVGLYPLLDTDYTRGKSGFKAVQYMAVGIPFVMSPVGVCATLGEANRTHFLASSDEEWLRALETLLSEPELRRDMGEAGRSHAHRNYALDAQCDKLAETLRGAARGARN